MPVVITCILQNGLHFSMIGVPLLPYMSVLDLHLFADALVYLYTDTSKPCTNENKSI